MRTLSFEFARLDSRFPIIHWGHYVDNNEDTYYFKFLWFNLYLTK